MSILDRLRALVGRKADERPPQAWVVGPGEPVWTPRDYASFAREGYQANPYVYRAIDLIAKAVAGVPWLLYAAGPDGDEEITEHALLDLMRHPNPRTTWSGLLEATVGHLMISGNAYVVRLPERGQPVELWVLRPPYVTVEVDAAGMPAAYVYDPGRGRRIRYTTEQVLHLRFWHPSDEIYGLSPIEAAARSVDLNNAGRAWNAALLQNGAVPAGALVVPHELSETQLERLRAEFDRRHRGPARAGRPIVLEGGLEWRDIGITPREASWLEGLRLTAREIAVAFGVPPELLGDSENKTYSNYQEARRAFYTETVLPLLDRLTEEFSGFLCPLYSDALRLTYDDDQIEALAEDRAAVWERALDAVKAGVLTPNEAREMLGYTPVEGGGDLLAPASAIPVSGTPLESGAKAAPPSGSDRRVAYWKRFDAARRGYERALAERIERRFAAEAREVARAVRQGMELGAALAEQEPRWLRLIGAAHLTVARDYARRTLEELGVKAGRKGDPIADYVATQVAAWVASEGLRRVRGILKTTRQHLAREIAEGIALGESIDDIARRIQEAYDRIGPARARRIARTEVVGASNHGSYLGAKHSGLRLKKEWIATPDARTREDHANADGQVVDMDEPFSVGGALLMYPGDASLGAPASEIVNCRCTLAYRPEGGD